MARICLFGAGHLRREHGGHLRISTVAAFAPVEPARTRQCGAGPGLEHGRQLYHQHQLAVVYARDHDELSHSNGRPRVSQLPLGGDGHRGGCGPHPRHQADQFGHHRQLLGGHDALTALCAAAGLHHRRSADGCAGRTAEPARIHLGAYAGRPNADDRTGPRSLAGSHQGNGHQRRRILQRQQRPSLREPHAALEPLRNVLDLFDWRRTHVYTGPHDRLAGPRLGRAGRNVHTVLGRIHHRLLGRIASASAHPRCGSDR